MIKTTLLPNPLCGEHEWHGTQNISHTISHTDYACIGQHIQQWIIHTHVIIWVKNSLQSTWIVNYLKRSYLFVHDASKIIFRFQAVISGTISLIFDTEARVRGRKTHRKPATFSGFNEPLWGDQRYGYKVNEAKVLTSKRVGLDFDKIENNWFALVWLIY